VALMRLRNTQTGRLEPVAGAKIGLYVCGITPYDTTHLGHAFTYLTFDVLVRGLRAGGRSVRYVQNVTDLDDDVMRRARELGVSWDQLAGKETRLYQEDMAGLNVLPPDVFPRASETIPQILSMARRLEASGHAYARGGNLYYRIASFPEYGQLSQASRTQMIAWSRERGADPSDPRKEDPLDFVLWQRSLPDEPSWESPWSAGRPGWHIECSAMALEHLGPQVDIHGGGEDLVFPHHESEIAQSEAATGVRPFARIWMHVGMLRYRGEKMSKSLRNLVLVRDLLARFDADSIRVLLLRHHYREPWEYTEDQLVDAADWTAHLRAAAGANPDGAPLLSSPRAAAGEAVPGRSAEVLEALEDDLNTPLALEVVERLVRSNDPGWPIAAGWLGLRLGAGRDLPRTTPVHESPRD
jgi:L-cysteine:1D-myo-inositol 2-amino-2-deoxy-alpha-D-glucopyranoside ligase